MDMRITVPRFLRVMEHKVGTAMDKWLSSEQFQGRQIFGMLGPLILDQFFIFFISMLTASMISASSQASVAAVSLVNPLSYLVTTLFFAVSSGGTVIVAQYKGKGDEAQVKRAAGQVILSTFVVATFFTIVMMIFAQPLIHAIYGGGSTPTDPAVLERATSYLKGFCLSLPTFAIYNGIFSVLRGVGSTKVCLRLTVIINVVHLIASVIFLNVLKLDIMGTALSYNVARIIGCVIAVTVILSPKGSLTLRFKDMLGFNWSLQKNIVRMGIPFALEQVFFNGGMILSQMYMVGLGTASIAANSISSTIANLFYAAGFAVSTLAITIVGQCIGAGNIELAKQYGKKLMWMGCAVCVASIAVIYPCLPLVLKLFKPEAETLPIINHLLIIALIPMPFFWSMSNIMPSVLRAAGDAGYTSGVSLSTMWIFRVGLGYMLAIPLGFGVHGIWVAMGIEWAVRSLMFWLRFRGVKWYKKSVI